MDLSEENAKIITYILAWYALFLAICGTICNLFASAICFQINKVSTFKILSILFIFETISLYTVCNELLLIWNLDIFLKWFMPFKGANQTINEYNVIESLSLATCKIFTFSQFYSLQVLSWLMAYVSVDQVIKLYIPRITYSLNPKNVYKICLLIAAILFLVNLHILIFNGKVSYTKTNVTDALNITSEIEVMSFECYSTNYYEFFPFWDNVHLYLYGFGPFSVTMIANGMISYKILTMKSVVASASQQKKRKLTLTILFTSIIFIVFVTPEIIAFGYFFGPLSHSNAGTLVLYSVDLFHFTFNSFVAIIYYRTNKVFNEECKYRLITICCSIKLGICKGLHTMGCVSRDTLSKRIRAKELNTNRYYKGNKNGITSVTTNENGERRRTAKTETIEP